MKTKAVWYFSENTATRPHLQCLVFFFVFVGYFYSLIFQDIGIVIRQFKLFDAPVNRVIFLAGNIKYIPLAKQMKLVVIDISFVKYNDGVIGQFFNVAVKLLVVQGCCHIVDEGRHVRFCLKKCINLHAAFAFTIAALSSCRLQYGFEQSDGVLSRIKSRLAISAFRVLSEIEDL